MKTIIEMAREADLDWQKHWDNEGNRLERFAEIVRADERERIKQENQRCYVDRKSAQGGNT